METNEVYKRLFEIANIEAQFHCGYTQNNYNDHYFVLYGYSIESQEFMSSLNNFYDEYNPDKFKITNTSEGVHISFIFDNERLEGEPEPQASYDRVKLKNGSYSDKECHNCRRDVSDYPVPPIRIVRASSKFEDMDIEKYGLCVECSPGHYDDVVRSIDYFGVEDGEVTMIGFEDGNDIEWEKWEGENPFTKDTIEVIDKYIL